MDQYAAPVVWSPATRDHDPKHEVWVGVATEGTEVAARVDAILESATSAGHRIVEATDHPDDVLRAVHDPALLEFLATASDRWREGPYDELVGQDRVVPYLFPTPAMTAGLPTRPAVSVHADAGRFAYDTMTLIGPGTWTAARAAADCALTAVDLVVGGEPMAYALCRPPGHHATPAGFGGSCYLNNAAVAAQALRVGGFDRVGIVDVDAHQGNGTAAIFYERADVLYGSVHVDPAAGWFPHVVGPRRRDRQRRRSRRDPQPAAARGHRRRGVARRGARARRLGRGRGLYGARRLARCRRGEGRPGEPAAGDR